MRKYARRLLLPAMALLGAVSLTKTMYSWPDLFPVVLKAFGNAIVDAMGATTVESSSNIEVVYVFTVSLLIVLAVFAILRLMWVYAQKRKGRRMGRGMDAETHHSGD